MFTNTGSSSFFSFCSLTLFSPPVVDAVTFEVLAANLASFSNLFASFFAEHHSISQNQTNLDQAHTPELFEFGLGASNLGAGTGAGGAVRGGSFGVCDIFRGVDLSRGYRMAENRYRCLASIQLWTTQG